MSAAPAPRLPDEAARNGFAFELERYLTPLAARCDALEASPTLGETDAQLLDELTGFIAALYRYDEATDALLATYRHALEHAQRPAATPVPSREASLGLPEPSEATAPAWMRNTDPTPAELLAERQADPVYRLGFVRGHRQGCAVTERKYQHLSSLYAQYALLVPPPSYQPSPLVARLKNWLATRLMGGPSLPAATRRQLLLQTPAHIPHAA